MQFPSLEKIDCTCDYIPGVSTVTSLVKLFQKYVVLPRMNPRDIQSNRYFRALNTTDVARYAILLIPVLGNIVVGIVDFTGRDCDDKTLMLDRISKDASAVKDASYRLQRDPDFLLDALKRNPKVLNHIASKFRDDKNFWLDGIGKSAEMLDFVLSSKFMPLQPFQNQSFVKEAVTRNPEALRWAGKFKNEEEVVEAAVRQSGNVMKHAGPTLKSDQDFALRMAKIDSRVFLHVDVALWQDHDFVLRAVQVYGYVLCIASHDLRHTKEILLAAAEQNGSRKETRRQQLGYAALSNTDPEHSLRTDREFVLEMIARDPWDYDYAAESLKSDPSFQKEAQKRNPALKI